MRNRTTTRVLAMPAVALMAALAAAPSLGAEPSSPAPAPEQNPAPSPSPVPASAKPRLEIGKPAPAFTLRDSEGATVALEDFRGQVLVIEWLHPGCEASRHQHTAGPLRTLPGAFEGEPVAFIAINSVSSASEHGGREASIEARESLQIEYPVLIDESGAVATLYAMSTSPSVAVVDANGVVRYFGAIDNAPAGKLPEGQQREDYLTDAIFGVLDHTPIVHTTAVPTGCEIRPKPKKTS